jgi:hypothetical protein
LPTPEDTVPAALRVAVAMPDSARAGAARPSPSMLPSKNQPRSAAPMKGRLVTSGIPTVVKAGNSTLAGTKATTASGMTRSRPGSRVW